MALLGSLRSAAGTSTKSSAVARDQRLNPGPGHELRILKKKRAKTLKMKKIL
jgi:hypothetical protein